MADHDHIPTAEVKTDIADTEREIFLMTRQEKGYRLVGDKMSIFRADACAGGIIRRKDFIKKLQALLKERDE